MGSARLKGAVLKVMALALILATLKDPAVAQPTRPQWIYDYSQFKSNDAWLATNTAEKVTAFVDSRLSPSIEGASSWSEDGASAEQFFARNRSLVVGLSTSGKVVDSVEVLLRDLPGDKAGSILEGLKFSPGGDVDVIVKRPAGEKGVTKVSAPGGKDLAGKVAQLELDAMKRTVRFAALRRTLFLTVSPPDPEKERQKLGRTFVDSTKALVDGLRLGKGGTEGPLLAETDKFFNTLVAGNLVDDRLAAYDVVWRRGVRSELERGATAATELSAIVSFHTSLQVAALSASKTGATVTVSASKGNGALIRYAKLADVAKGLFVDLGVTIVVAQLERAKYEFRSYRGTSETGKAIADCSVTYCVVSIPEP